jgi:hypothetical protein
MEVILYSPLPGETEEKLQQVIESVIPRGAPVVYRTIGALAEKLRQPKNDLTITLLLTDKQEVLVRLLTVADLFRNTRLIFIAPDRNKDTDALDYQRRIFDCFDGKTVCIQGDRDFIEVFGVLNNIIADYQSHNGIGGRWGHASDSPDRFSKGAVSPAVNGHHHDLV